MWPKPSGDLRLQVWCPWKKIPTRFFSFSFGGNKERTETSTVGWQQKKFLVTCFLAIKRLHKYWKEWPYRHQSIFIDHSEGGLFCPSRAVMTVMEGATVFQEQPCKSYSTVPFSVHDKDGCSWNVCRAFLPTFSPCSSIYCMEGRTCLFSFLSFSWFEREEREREKEREKFVVSLMDSFISWFLYVPWLGIKPITLVYRDNTLARTYHNRNTEREVFFFAAPQVKVKV